VTGVAAGLHDSLAVQGHGTSYAVIWGDNSYGQLGLGGYDAPYYPTSSNPGTLYVGGTLSAIAPGETHVLVLVNGCQVMAWGSDTYGELGLDSAGYNIDEPRETLFTKGVCPAPKPDPGASTRAVA